MIHTVVATDRKARAGGQQHYRYPDHHRGGTPARHP